MLTTGSPKWAAHPWAAKRQRGGGAIVAGEIANCLRCDPILNSRRATQLALKLPSGDGRGRSRGTPPSAAVSLTPRASLHYGDDVGTAKAAEHTLNPALLQKLTPLALARSPGQPCHSPSGMLASTAATAGPAAIRLGSGTAAACVPQQVSHSCCGDWHACFLRLWTPLL